MDCGAYIAKYVLCIFNFILFLGGAAILALGVWLYVDKNSFLAFTKVVDENSLPQLENFTQPTVVTQVAYILIAAGAFIFVLSLLGYCGALSESRCLLGLFGFLLVVILILEITAGGLAYVYKDKAEIETKQFLKNTIQDYYTTEKDKTDPATLMWNLLMQQMECCGVDNGTDFQTSEKFKVSGLKVPQACCKLNETTHLPVDPDCTKNPGPQNSYFQSGCYKRLIEVIMEYMNYVIYAVIGIVAIELLSTCLSFCLCRALEPYDDK